MFSCYPGLTRAAAAAWAITYCVLSAVSFGARADGEFAEEDVKTGILGSETDDTIVVVEPLGVVALMEVLGASFPIIGSGDFTGSVSALAGATGVDALAGLDAIGITNPVVANAIANASGVSADGSMTGNASANIQTTASAFALGVKAGDGDDLLISAAPLMSSAAAAATAVDATLAADGELVSSANPGDALTEAGTLADARATAISGGNGADQIDNVGNLAGTAAATTTSASGGITFGIGLDEDVDAGAALSDGSSQATAVAAGIDAGQADDSISNSGAIAVGSSATATGVAFGLDVAGSLSGTIETGTAIIDSRTQAEAIGVGISGGGDNDSILNSGHIGIVATPGATAVAADLSVTVSEEGDITSGAGVSDASTLAAGNAVGIDGGDGDDTIFTASAESPGIELLTISNATGVAVSLNVAGSLSGGVDAGDSISTARTVSDAEVTGVSGGSGNDHVTNLSGIASTSIANSTAVGVGLSAALNMGGDVTAGGAVSDTRTDASAIATGIGGGTGDDRIDNTGPAAGIATTSAATGTAVGVALSVSGRIATEETAANGGGDVSGAVVSDSGAFAGARSVGLDGDSGSDQISNQAAIISGATALGIAVDVGLSGAFNVGIEVAPEGDVTGMALSNADVGAGASAAGIDGGDDADTILNNGSIIAGSTAEAVGVAAALNVTGNVSYKDESEDDDSSSADAVEGQALTSSATYALAESAGMAGGAGDDGISNEGTIVDVNAHSNAIGVSAALDVAAGVGIESDAALDVSGVAVSDTSVSSESFAAGIDSGAGDDSLINNREIIWVRSDSEATGVAASLNVSGNLSYKGDTAGTIEGAALSDSSTSAAAGAVALSGGEGDDVIESNANLGTVHASADATGVSASLDVAAGLAIKGDVDDASITGRALSDATVDAAAAAIAIDGGGGADEITSSGGVANIEAIADAVGVAANINVSGSLSFKGDTEASVSGEAVSSSGVTASSLAAGISGGEGDDTIGNEANFNRIYSQADATAVSAGIDVAASVTVKGDSETTLDGTALNESSVTAEATALGIHGGEGADEITNSGAFPSLYSDATATGVAAGANVAAAVTVKANADADVTGEAISDTSVNALAETAGLAGGAGNDTVENSQDLVLLANSDATGVAATLDVAAAVTFKGVQQADVESSAASDASVTATSVATGIDGGTGTDTLTNTGNILLMVPGKADADALGVSASLSVAGNLAIKGIATGEVSSVAGSNANVTAEAVATGIAGGEDSDTITNSGVIVAHPGADATGVAASLSVGGNMLGEATSAAMSESMVVARSVATGIDGGTGDDDITNEGVIDLMNQTPVPAMNQVDAEATAVAVSVDVVGTIIGEAGGAAIANSQSIADARATGVAGGAGADSITNHGPIVADVDSETDTVAVGVSVTVTGNGSAEGAALTDARALSTAFATGLSGGEGDDVLDSRGNILLNTNSDSSATAVSIGLAGSARGTAEGTSLANGSATAVSRSVGLDGGGGVDDIDSTSPLVVTVAGATSNSDSVSVQITGAMGLASGSSIADASANSESYSAAVHGGSGADIIDNTSVVNAIAESIAEASSTSVGVTFAAGVADSVGTGDSSASATAAAVAIEGGDDDDEISNSAVLTATPAAIATAGSTTVTVGITAGYAEGDTSATTAAVAEVFGAGLSGGAGNDVINNAESGTITVGGAWPQAVANASSTAVNVGLTVGAAVNETVADTSATALTNLAAISGGTGDDSVSNAAVLNAGQSYGMSLATGTADAVNVSVTLGASLGETASNSSANAESVVVGISGDAGNDNITNIGTINVGLAPPVDLSGLMTVASASSETVGVSITVGGSFQDASADASANATNTTIGIAGGDNDDIIDNSAAINAYSSAGTIASGEATKASLSLGVSGGSATSNASSTSTAISAGIDGGSGNDDIDTLADLDVRSWSLATAKSTAKDYNILSVGAALQSAEANSAATALAEARGVHGGAGSDDIVVGNIDAPGLNNLNVAAASIVNSEARSASISGFGVGLVEQQARSGAETTAHALAAGIDGGEGDDRIVAASVMNVAALTTGVSVGTSSTNTGFTLGGVARGESASNARTTVLAESVGIRGGEATLGPGESDADDILGIAPITVTSISSGISESTATAASPVTVFGSAEGEAVADASAVVVAKGTGIEGGAGDDVITVVEDEINSGTIDIQSDATANVTSSAKSDATVVFGDASTMGVSDASATIAARSLGISGGEGDDTITSQGTIRIGSLASGDISARSQVNADVTFGAASSGAVSDASASKYSFSAGIDGGSGSDSITNDALLEVRATSGGTVTSTSSASSDSTFYSASSSTLAMADLEGTTVTHGVLGGAGNDSINNLGTVSSVSDASLLVASLSFATADSTFGDATATASSAAAATGSAASLGIDAGTGNDVINNSGALDATARGNTTVISASIAIADSTFGDEYTAASSVNYSAGSATSSAIEGGDGDDEIINDNLVNAAAEAGINVVSLTLSSDGPAYSDARTIASADAAGISGGAGNDQIANDNTLLVSARPRVFAATRTQGGGVGGLIGVDLNATAAGIRGGEGDDVLVNSGDVVTVAGRQSASTVTATAEAGALVIRDAGRIGANPGSLIGKWVRVDLEGAEDLYATIVDFDPETGDMRLSTPAPVTLVAGANYVILDVPDGLPDIFETSFLAGGAVSLDASTNAFVETAGLDGGAGFDEVSNFGNLRVAGSNSIFVGEFNIGALVSANMRSSSSVNAIGIAGENVDNQGAASASADALLRADGATYSVYGSSIGQRGLATATATGIEGDAMLDNSATNFGMLDIRSQAEVRSLERVFALFANSNQQLEFEANSAAVGLAGGAGAENITNAEESSLEVLAEAIGTIQGVTTTYPWFSNLRRTVNLVDATADASAFGLELEGGDAAVANLGDIEVTSTASVLALAVSNQYEETSARANADATARAWGIHGHGSERIVNTGAITVTAAATANSVAQAAQLVPTQDQSEVTSLVDEDALSFVDESLQGTAETDLLGKHLRFPDALDLDFLEAGSIIEELTAENAELDANQFVDTVYEGENPIGLRIRFEDTEQDYVSTVTDYDEETGIFTLETDIPDDVLADSGYNMYVLTAEVVAFDSATGQITLSNPLPDDGVVAGTRYSLSIVSNLTATNSFQDETRIGEEVPLGTVVGFASDPDFEATVIEFDPDTGTFTLSTDIPDGVVVLDVYTLKVDVSEGQSGSDAKAFASGVELGNGGTELVSTGDIIVHASATADTEATGRQGAPATATAEAVAEARGVVSSSGMDRIENGGTIEVAADVIATSSSTTIDRRVLAIGIETGAGDDVVINNGEMIVTASLSGDPTTGIDDINVIGITTGDGDDAVENFGTVSALMDNAGVISAGVAIDLGAGNDTLILGPISTTTGSVQLGEGDDILHLFGDPGVVNAGGETSDLLAGNGLDTLVMHSEGFFAGMPVGFEATEKLGSGDYRLPILPTMERLRIDEGRLVLDSGYAFSGTGAYDTLFYADGRNGQLAANGPVSLGGSIEVGRVGETYIVDGTRYSLITASEGISGEFADVMLPEALPLLSFELALQQQSVDLLAVASPFETVASNQLLTRVATNLDATAAGASGDYAIDLGHLQALPGGFDRALESFSPDAHQVVNEGATKLIQQSTALLQNHLRNSRTRYRNEHNGGLASAGLAVFASSNGFIGVGLGARTAIPVPLYASLPEWTTLQSVSNGTTAAAPRPYSSSRSQGWLLGMGSRGNYDAVDGYTGFEQETGAFAAGYDVRVSDSFIVGIGGGRADTELTIPDAFAEGGVDGWFGNAYASWFDEKSYLEWGVTYNKQDIDATRWIEMEGDSRVAESVREGDAMSVFLGGGRLFEHGERALEPYMQFQYFRLDEEGFSETGAGTLNQIVEPRETKALFGEAGASFVQTRYMDNGKLNWHLLLGVNHDFDIDERRIQYAYEGAPGTILSLDGRDVSTTSGLLGCGVTYIGERASISLDYRGRFNSDYEEQSAAATVSVQF